MKRLFAALAFAWLTAGCVGSGSPAAVSVGQSSGVGPITIAVGTVGNGYMNSVIARWNQAHPTQRVSILPLPPATDDQRAQMVNDLQLHSNRYDVLDLDVIWTAEFADAGWITPLDAADFPVNRFLAPAVQTGMFRGRLYAVPYNSNAGLLYYRSDILKTPPTTWAQLRQEAMTVAPRHRMGGYAGQFQAYEGLTVNFAEAVQSAGGSIVAGGGTQVAVDSPQALAGLDFLVDGFREGWIPKAALGYQEDQSEAAFQSGQVLFLRNWPYTYHDLQLPGPGNAVYGRFGVATLPGEDARHPGSSSLGGSDLAISAYSKHQRTALAFIQFLTSEPIQRQVLVDGSFPPVWASLYDDPALIREFPYLPTLKRSIESALPRPENPNYGQMSLIISTDVYSALTQKATPQAALASMATDLRGAMVSR